ncbi:Heterokaryon incompatibility 6 OR allele [Fusarium albosuccineum]|uniref:Heterokaryon incompatibility 6 OR allele n=1 Tax=Fusarium albosuccineum TaxID=1237068 RepID=A0A8H4PIZ9_9HYPO|nr:Heterokaryon incompatibility 6 OR allele [Fusarium albosuccineum]
MDDTASTIFKTIPNDYHEYRPLDESQEQIRLLSIPEVPSDDGVPRCRIIRASLKNPPQYTALSYTWGDVRDTSKIWVDFAAEHDPSAPESDTHFLSFNVINNLRNALASCNQEAHQGPYLLWVDMLCINQGDIPERSQQVQLMGKIFRQATNVLVWLPPELDDPVTFNRDQEIAAKMATGLDHEDEVDKAIAMAYARARKTATNREDYNYVIDWFVTDRRELTWREDGDIFVALFEAWYDVKMNGETAFDFDEAQLLFFILFRPPFPYLGENEDATEEDITDSMEAMAIPETREGSQQDNSALLWGTMPPDVSMNQGESEHQTELSIANDIISDPDAHARKKFRALRRYCWWFMVNIIDWEVLEVSCQQYYMNKMAVLGNTWFCRIWVLQEVANNARVSVRRGSYQTSWDVVAKMATTSLSMKAGIRRLCAARGSFSQRLVGAYTPNRTLGDDPRVEVMWSFIEPGREHRIAWLNLLSMTAGFRCSDSRDKTFGLLGMKSLRLEAGYDETTPRVYAKFFQAIIDSDQDLRILHFVLRPEGSVLNIDKYRSSCEFPHWMTNLSLSSHFHLSLPLFPGDMRTASSWFVPLDKPPPRPEDPPEHLIVAGIEIGTVAGVVGPLEGRYWQLRIFSQTAEDEQGNHFEPYLMLKKAWKAQFRGKEKRSADDFGVSYEAGNASDLTRSHQCALLKDLTVTRYALTWTLPHLGDVQTNMSVARNSLPQNLLLHNMAQDVLDVEELYDGSGGRVWRDLAEAERHCDLYGPDLSSLERDVNAIDSPFKNPHSVFFTADGRLGICPPETRPGDVVVFLSGDWSPYLLRRKPVPEFPPSVKDIELGTIHEALGCCNLEGYMSWDCEPGDVSAKFKEWRKKKYFRII